MQRFLKGIVAAVALAFSGAAYAQSDRTYSISGTIREAATGEPVIMASFAVNNSVGTVTDKDGFFRIEGLKKGRLTYTVSSLGFASETGVLELNSDIKDFDIRLELLSLGLDEVVVTAESKAAGSVSKIGEDAIRHIQPMSVTDMFQLIPGNLSSNPSLSSAGQASVREISPNSGNSMGASVVMDGAPLSNDSNLQTLSSSYSGVNVTQSLNGLGDQSTTGKGVDLRTVSPDNIESMEVIRGIPSAEYGNLTSGVVILKTKSGVTPYQLKFKADPFSKMVYAGKGFALKRGDAVNAGIDWTQSFSDPRKRYLGFERVTATLGYSSNFPVSGRQMQFRVNGSFYTNVNTSKTDPQMQATGSTYSSRNTGLRLNFEGSWKISGKVLTVLDYNIMASQSFQTDSMHDFIASASGAVTNTMTPGVAEGVFLPGSYYSDYEIDGKPFNVYVQLKVGKLFQFGNKGYDNIKAGLNWQYEQNFGRGLIFDINLPPQNTTSQALRPRSFRDIPALNNLSAFVENKLDADIGNTGLMLVTGVRFTNMFLDQRAGRKNIFVSEPRLNLEYTFLDVEDMRISVSGGWGLSYKTPSLLYLYPDDAYFDRVSLLKKSENETGSLSLMTTDILSDLANSSLKPARSNKVEAGLNFRFFGIKGNVNWFKELHTDEFGFSSIPHFMHYNTFSVPSGATDLRYENGKVWFTDAEGVRHTAQAADETYIATYLSPVNKGRTEKQGVEYSIDLGTWKALRTSLVLDGAWFHIMRYNTENYYSKVNETYGFIKYMPSGNGSIETRFNTNFRFITHIPSLKLVFSTTVQAVWYESYQEIWKDKDGADRFFLGEDGKFLNVVPLGFKDKSGQYHSWKPEYTGKPEYSEMVTKRLLPSYDKEVFKPWVMVNFRLTKEIGKVLEVSFTANNFTNSSRWHKYATKAGYRQIYPDMYFGAELKINIGKFMSIKNR